ncbi:MAG TPA: rhomboid family intramembrane serine protease [Candidatus Koribacter sp.]|jgi:rhomboid protease GluP
MTKCEQCGTEFSNWFGDVKRVCPRCEQQASPQILPPEAAGQPAAPKLVLPAPIVTRVLIGINVAVYLAMVLSTRQFLDFDTPTVLKWGADFAVLTTSGEWWRMLTAMFLHGGLLHIAVNMWALRNLGYTCELFYGRRNFTIIYMLSGLAGSAGTMIWDPVRISVGASGAIFGVAGALAALVYFKKLPVDRAVLKRDIGSIGAVIVVNLLIGGSVGIIDNSAHVGGLIAGTLLGIALPAVIFRAEREKSAALGNAAAVGVLCVIIAIAAVCKIRVAGDVEAYRAVEAYYAGNKTAAYQHAARAADMHPQSAGANKIIGSLLLEQGQYEKALPFLQKAFDQNPKDPDLKSMLDDAARGTPQK